MKYSDAATIRSLIAVLWIAASVPAAAEAIAVPQVESGLTIRSAPTVTIVRESPKARAVLILIPGGDGHIGFEVGRPDPPSRSAFGKALDMLRDPAQSSGSVHVVFFDNPFPLGQTPQLISSRASNDHMVRILSVVQFYRDRFKLPVVLMGHSNGGYSIAAFQKYLEDNGKADLLAGMIFSAGRDLSQFGSKMGLPVLFMGSERDGCGATTPAGLRSNYERVKATNKGPTEFVAVKGGEPQPMDPCYSGLHMYNGAHDEVAKIIDEFLLKDVLPK